MRKILIGSLALAIATTTTTTTSVSLAADEVRTSTRAPAPVPAGGNDRLLTVPPSPFESPRSPFDLDPRPPLVPPERLLPSVERELDRGDGRIESDVDFELRRQMREADERRGVVREQRESERLDEEYDRRLRLDQQARRSALAESDGRFIETESRRLAADRERFYRSAGIDAGGAAHDARVLKDLERAYQRDLKQLKRDRAAELKRLAREELPDNERGAARDGIVERYNAAQTRLRERYAADRARVMGQD